MAELIILLVVLVCAVLIWKVAQSFKANQFLIEIAANTSKEQAEAQYGESMGIVVARQTAGNASGYSQKESNEHLERAVFMQDRLNELSGLPHGPAARLQIRSGLIKFLKP